MTTSLSLPFADPVLAEIVGSSAGAELSVVTVLLVLLLGLTACLLRAVLKLRQEVAALRPAPPVPVLLPAAPAPAVAPASQVAVASQPEPAGPPTEDIIAIAAAVHAFLGPKAQVVGIVPVAVPELQVWSLEGRRQVFQSHRIR